MKVKGEMISAIVYVDRDQDDTIDVRDVSLRLSNERSGSRVGPPIGMRFPRGKGGGRGRGSAAPHNF